MERREERVEAGSEESIGTVQPGRGERGDGARREGSQILKTRTLTQSLSYSRMHLKHTEPHFGSGGCSFFPPHHKATLS